MAQSAILAFIKDNRRLGRDRRRVPSMTVPGTIAMFGIREFAARTMFLNPATGEPASRQAQPAGKPFLRGSPHGLPLRTTAAT
jgi:hypothetical protein